MSTTTLLRQIRRQAPAAGLTPRVLGVDDFAFRRGRTYGTILVDLQKRCLVGLLPDRQAQTLQRWLQGHPGWRSSAGTGPGAYAEGARKGAPDALQVADRWHLLKNLGDALEKRLMRCHQQLGEAAQHLAAASLPQDALPQRTPQQVPAQAPTRAPFPASTGPASTSISITSSGSRSKTGSCTPTSASRTGGRVAGGRVAGE